MKPSIKEARDLVTNKFELRAKSYEDAMNEMRGYAHVLAALTDEYVLGGIAVFPSKLVSGMEAWQKPRSYIRALASDLKRPFIYAEEHYWSGQLVYELQVARSDRLSDVVAGFLLISKVVPQEPNYWTKPEHDVIRCDTGGTWRVWFNGKVGHELFNHFVHKVRTDPVTRIVLKLA